MKSPLYYIVMIGLIIALVIVLILLIKKRRRDDEAIRAYQQRMDQLRAERQAEEEKKRKHYSTYNEDDDHYIPKYAAGDDMDRLNRECNYQKESNGPLILAGIGLSFIVSILLLGIFAPSPQTPAQPSKGNEKLNMEILSSETNQNRTKVYVTLRYENQSTISCYNIDTTVTLNYGDVIADTVKHTVSLIPGGTETEEIVTLEIPAAHKNDAYYVKAHVEYKWKIT